MTESQALVIRSWLHSWKTWVVLTVIAAAAVFQIAFRGSVEPRFLIVDYLCGLAIGVNARALLGDHVMLAGRRLVPGLIRVQTRLMLTISAILLAPAVVAALLREEWRFAAVLFLGVGLFLGLLIALVRAKAVRGAVAGVSAGLFVPVVGALTRTRTADPNFAATVFVNDAVFALSIVLGLTALAGWILWLAIRSDDVPGILRSTRTGSGDSCDANGEGEWLAAMVPGLRRGPTQILARADLPGPAEVSRLFRSTMGPIRPAAYAVMFMALFTLATWDDLRAGDLSEITDDVGHYMAFMLGIIPLSMLYTRRLLRIEAMRPVSRTQLISGFASAFLRDYATYVITVAVLTVGGHLISSPATVASSAYWATYLLLPGAMAVAVTLTLFGMRWTRFAGLVSYVLVIVSSVALAETVLLGAGTHVWLLASVVGLTIAWGVGRGAARVWRDVEIGSD